MARSAYTFIAVCASTRNKKCHPRHAPRSGDVNLSNRTNIDYRIQFHVYPKNTNIHP